jgi:hypothetical protein
VPKKRRTDVLGELSREDLLEILARELLEKRSREKAKVQPTPPQSRTDWARVFHTCPKCGFHGAVDPEFGVRMVRGVEQKQSYCKRCRATLSYYNKPRKRRTHS